MSVPRGLIIGFTALQRGKRAKNCDKSVQIGCHLVGKNPRLTESRLFVESFSADKTTVQNVRWGQKMPKSGSGFALRIVRARVGEIQCPWIKSTGTSDHHA